MEGVEKMERGREVEGGKDRTFSVILTYDQQIELCSFQICLLLRVDVVLISWG